MNKETSKRVEAPFKPKMLPGTYGMGKYKNPALDIPPDFEKRLNKAFAYILKTTPDFYMARIIYRRLKSKDLTKSVCPDDLIKKAAAVMQFQSIMKVDLFSPKYQKEAMRVRINVGKI